MVEPDQSTSSRFRDSISLGSIIQGHTNIAQSRQLWGSRPLSHSSQFLGICHRQTCCTQYLRPDHDIGLPPSVLLGPSRVESVNDRLVAQGAYPVQPKIATTEFPEQQRLPADYLSRIRRSTISRDTQPVNALTHSDTGLYHPRCVASGKGLACLDYVNCSASPSRYHGCALKRADQNFSPSDSCT